MEIIGSIFDDYRIILYYDDSNDDTLNKVKEYKNKNPRILFYVNKSELLPYRTHRIALGRNTCLKMIKEQFSDFEYFIMMDCDDRCAKDMNIDLLKYYLQQNNWDSLSFNHPDGYYDSWALSKIPYVVSCHHFRDNSKGIGYITKIINKTPKNIHL
jgi:glycosyltransferase involved in cell wall biosynthesis